ncbi:MAG: hypothetical protein ACRC5A_07705 [Enterobacteriaceae bacterium]
MFPLDIISIAMLYINTALLQLRKLWQQSAHTGLLFLCAWLLSVPLTLTAACHNSLADAPSMAEMALPESAHEQLHQYLECVDHCASDTLFGGQHHEIPATTLHTDVIQPVAVPAATQQSVLHNGDLVVDPPAEIRFCRYRE